MKRTGCSKMLTVSRHNFYQLFLDDLLDDMLAFSLQQVFWDMRDQCSSMDNAEQKNSIKSSLC